MSSFVAVQTRYKLRKPFRPWEGQAKQPRHSSREKSKALISSRAATPLEVRKLRNTEPLLPVSSARARTHESLKANATFFRAFGKVSALWVSQKFIPNIIRES